MFGEIVIAGGNGAALITALGGMFSALAALLSGIAAAYAVWARREVVTVRHEVANVRDHVNKVERATNGMKTELVEAVRAASFAEGAKSETDKTTGGEARGP